jgi:hypothetical protein
MKRHSFAASLTIAATSVLNLGDLR